jgi:hypothetical protein
MTNITRFTLRLPETLYAQVKASARRERRSIHGQMLWLIERGLESTSTGHDQAEGPSSDPQSPSA